MCSGYANLVGWKATLSRSSIGGLREHFDRSPQMLADFVRLKVDVIVTHGTANVVAAKQTTSVIPIVFAAVSDPVGTNLVVSLGRPGSNVTGLSNEAPDLAR